MQTLSPNRNIFFENDAFLSLNVSIHFQQDRCKRITYGATPPVSWNYSSSFPTVQRCVWHNRRDT